MNDFRGQKRKRFDRDPSPSRSRHTPERSSGHSNDRNGRSIGSRNWNTSDQARLNQLQEEERHREFLAREGQFVLEQKRKAADIRVKEDRARPIDFLTANLRIIDPLVDLLNSEIDDDDFDYTDAEAIIRGLSAVELSKLRSEIEEFLDLETKPRNRDYWKTMRVLCKNQQQGIEGRAVRSVSADIDKLLRPKSFEEFEKLEKQVKRKLDSDEPIDTDYWQQLLDHLLVHKAKATLKKLYQAVLDKKLNTLRKENQFAAKRVKGLLSQSDAPRPTYSTTLDPEPSLNLDETQKTSSIVDEAGFLKGVEIERQKVMAAKYIPAPKKVIENGNTFSSHGRSIDTDGKAALSMFDREAAKGVEEDEEVFAGEEQVENKGTVSWKGQYRARKPRYFNRVQMGYEWNKYNQTHYDHDNPPPKVVQGYKFHIFYPDLVDPTKAPTYKIIREGGRKKGETVAPAGEEDTCIIRFVSGPPYEDVAFRIVDRDWDYSAKHDRGFRSTFENGILTLHFSFKKVYYRK